jgi:acetylornithine deacetylase/succinyl-diaminopimelate desuccinylase-like protein
MDRVNIDVEEVLSLAEAMVAIPSVSGGEEPLARFLVAWLAERGVDADLQVAAEGRPNVIGRVAGTTGELGLVLNGHIDMGEPYDGAPDPYHPHIDGEWMYGAAISNMKAAVAGMAAAVAAVRRSGVRLSRELVLTGVVGECDEFGLGTKAAIAGGLDRGFAICGEPTTMAVRLLHVGMYQFAITVFGVAAHQKERDRGRNAIDDAMSVLPFIDETQLSYTEHDVLGRPQIVIGQIAGGILPMATAPSCTLTGDIRTVPGMTADSITRDLEAMLEGARTAVPGLRVSLEPLRNSPPFEMFPDAEIVQAVAASHAEVRGTSPTIDRSRQLGVTDSSHLLHAGIPTALYGPGTFSLLSEDRVRVGDIVDAARVYAATALRVCA